MQVPFPFIKSFVETCRGQGCSEKQATVLLLASMEKIAEDKKKKKWEYVDLSKPTPMNDDIYDMVNQIDIDIPKVSDEKAKAYAKWDALYPNEAPLMYDGSMSPAIWKGFEKDRQERNKKRNEELRRFGLTRWDAPATAAAAPLRPPSYRLPKGYFFIDTPSDNFLENILNFGRVGSKNKYYTLDNPYLPRRNYLNLLP